MCDRPPRLGGPTLWVSGLPAPDAGRSLRQATYPQLLHPVLGHGRGQCARDWIHAAKVVGRSGRFRRAHDPSGLVDPDALRHVDHAVKAGDAMIDIDQAPVGSIGLFDPGTGMLSTTALLGDRDNGEILGLQAVR